MKTKIIQYLLGTLLLLVAINAFGGGYYGMAGAESVPVEWLKNSPFNTYFIPSLILFFVVGGSCLISAIAVFRRRSWAKKIAFISAGIIFCWLATQVAIIGYVSWMQPATAIAAVLIVLLCLLYPKNAMRNINP